MAQATLVVICQNSLERARVLDWNSVRKASMKVATWMVHEMQEKNKARICVERLKVAISKEQLRRSKRKIQGVSSRVQSNQRAHAVNEDRGTPSR